MTGSDVVTLQKLLNHHLTRRVAPLVEDGVFGPATKSRVMDFQTRNHLLPTKLRYPTHYPREFRKALAIDGVVGQHTLHVLIDTREIKSIPGASVSPPKEASPSSPANRERGGFGLTTGATGDPPPPGPSPSPPPGPSPSPSPPPSRVFKIIQLQQGTAGFLNPWSLSPFVLTLQGVLLAKNDGLPDVLVTGGIQGSLNDGNPKANDRWTGQGFIQAGLGFNKQLKLFGRTLDLANPFVQATLAQNLNKNFKQNPGATIGGAIGNQVTWKIIEKLLPNAKTPDDTQDTVSVFFNGQLASGVALNNGKGQGFPVSGMLGITWSFF